MKPANSGTVKSSSEYLTEYIIPLLINCALVGEIVANYSATSNRASYLNELFSVYHQATLFCIHDAHPVPLSSALSDFLVQI